MDDDNRAAKQAVGLTVFDVLQMWSTLKADHSPSNRTKETIARLEDMVGDLVNDMKRTSNQANHDNTSH